MSSAMSVPSAAAAALATFQKDGRTYKVTVSEYDAAKSDPSKTVGSGMAGTVFKVLAVPASASAGSGSNNNSSNSAAIGAGFMAALKVASSPAKDGNLSKEAATLRRLKGPHVNVIKLYASCQADGRQALLLDLVVGGTLLDALGSGPLDLPEAAFVVGQVLRGVNHLRRSHLVHRDLKMSNVLLAAGRRAVIMDFDLACSEGERVATNVVTGTTGFLPFEQAASAPTVTSAADSFAAGCLLARSVLPGPGLFPVDAGDAATLRRRALTALVRCLGPFAAADENAVGVELRPSDRPAAAEASKRPLASLLTPLPAAKRPLVLGLLQDLLRYQPAHRVAPMGAFGRLLPEMAAADRARLPHLSPEERADADAAMGGQPGAKATFGSLY